MIVKPLSNIMGVSVGIELWRTKGRAYSPMVKVKNRRRMKGDQGGRMGEFRWTGLVQDDGDKRGRLLEGVDVSEVSGTLGTSSNHGNG